MARDLGARSEANALRTWWQGGAAEGSRLACRAVNMNRLCARKGCAHDGAALPLTCVLKKYES